METVLHQNKELDNSKTHRNSCRQQELDQQMATEAITKEISQGFQSMNSRLIHIEGMMEKEQVCCRIL
jgi:hypothetical protein